MQYSGAPHLKKALTPTELRETLKNAKRLKKSSFDTIVVTGLSGQMFGGPLAYILGKPIIVVRKERDRNRDHESCPVEGSSECRNYLVVDDMVDTGKTLKRVFDAMKLHRAWAKCCGVYLYWTDRYINTAELRIKYPDYSDCFADTPSMITGASPDDSRGLL